MHKKLSKNIYLSAGYIFISLVTFSTVTTLGSATTTYATPKTSISAEKGHSQNPVLKTASNERLKTFENKQLNKQNSIPIFGDRNGPQSADEVKPSADLREIIDRIKNQTIPSNSEYHKSKEINRVSESAKEIIKNQGEALVADEVSPSLALTAVMHAYRNGSLNYNKPETENENIYYHPQYTDISLDSIYDLTVLRTGQDIFLSLGYKPLKPSQRQQKDLTSQRIKELQLTIFAIKRRETKKSGIMTAEEQEFERIKRAAKSSITPRKLLAERILDFFGIRRKKIDDNYEEMAHSYEQYKKWSERWENWEKMIKRKKKRRYKAHIPASQYERGININFDQTIQPYGKQIKIDPYENGRIKLLKTK